MNNIQRKLVLKRAREILERHRRQSKPVDKAEWYKNNVTEIKLLQRSELKKLFKRTGYIYWFDILEVPPELDLMLRENEEIRIFNQRLMGAIKQKLNDLEIQLYLGDEKDALKILEDISAWTPDF